MWYSAVTVRCILALPVLINATVGRLVSFRPLDRGKEPNALCSVETFVERLIAYGSRRGARRVGEKKEKTYENP